MKLRQKLTGKTRLITELVGVTIILLVWIVVTSGLRLFPKSIFPDPASVLVAIKDMHFNDALIRNAVYSFKLNVYGLMEATVLAIPLGMLIGLIPWLRATFERYITAIRFLPLTALIGLFIVWFGIDINMKIQFLAFSIFLYLLPIIIERVDGVEEVYVSTVKTLGATNWQTVKTIFVPAVISRSFDDVRVLAALSWTYIVVAEMVNSNGGGLGALAYVCSRQSKIDKVFGVLMVIILIGYIQDKFLGWLDKQLFPFKYLGGKK